MSRDDPAINAHPVLASRALCAPAPRRPLFVPREGWGGAILKCSISYPPIPTVY